MFAAEEYLAYIKSENKNSLNCIVTLEQSENNYQEYFKRLLLRRLFLFDDFTDRENEVLLRRLGVTHPPQSIEEIAFAFNVTRERIRQINAKALHKMRYPGKRNSFLCTFTTKEDLEKATELAKLDNAHISETLQDYILLFEKI